MNLLTLDLGSSNWINEWNDEETFNNWNDDKLGTIGNENYSEYIDLEALFDMIRTSVQKGMIPLKPMDVFQY